MNTHIGYKLFRVRKDGTLGSLFINASARLPIGKWMWASSEYRKKGFAYRPGWHVTPEPEAPHLGTKGRQWYKVEFCHHTIEDRPPHQGGRWYLARRIRILHAVYPDKQKEIIRHAIGYHTKNPGYRNHFCTGEGSTDYPHCEELVARGFMWRSAAPGITPDYIYRPTDRGIRWAHKQ